MDRLVGSGSQNALRTSSSQLYLFPHSRSRPQLEILERPAAKRRRSASPLNERLARSKRAALLHHSTEPTLMKNNWENDLIPDQSHKPITTISATVESINECATRLGLENNRLQDIEMDSCPDSDREEEDDLEPNYQRVTVEPVTLNSNPVTLLPLHRPHPIAYQQHLALISSNRSNKALKSIDHLNQPKKKPLEDIKVKKLNKAHSP